ncbi:hypothetical protein [Streptomyces sp. NPDC002205]|uniref:hypothetical protein n=1 Tax=Streptomyces sp. NPDC002205 TaxID=3154411 RepID=UPI003323E573
MTALLDAHPHLGVEPVLRQLRIASSTYYRWRRAEREPCARRRQDVELTEQIPASGTDLRRKSMATLLHIDSSVVTGEASSSRSVADAWSAGYASPSERTQ